MKTIMLQIVFSCLLLSCSDINKINRDKSVDKSKLLGCDYRLFQNTPAWELAKAVWDEDEKKIKDIVSKNPELINYQEPKFGSTLLMLTIKNQQLKPFRVLISNKADVNIYDTYDGTSALIEACTYDFYSIQFVKTLLENGADINFAEIGERRQGNTTRYTPLIAAAETGSLDLVKMLVKYGADINYKNEYGGSAFNSAVMLDKYKVALYLIKNGADYSSPIFIRFGNSYPYNPEEDTPMYLIDVLKEDNHHSMSIGESVYRKRLIELLKNKGEWGNAN